MTKHLNDIKKLFFSFSGRHPESILELTPAGSPRQYFRVISENISLVATVNSDEAEIHAFNYLSKHLKSKGILVPEVLAVDAPNHLYLQEDVGDISLYSLIENNNFRFDENIGPMFYKVLNDLIKIQVNAHIGLDYSKCYPVAAFDIPSILFDLGYFKEYFLKPMVNNFDEDKLEKDFKQFASFLSMADTNFFMFRDFQTRNIFIKGSDIYYIDFQGGRRGPLQYDIASLLNQSRIKMPFKTRELYLNYYLAELEKETGVSRQSFMKFYPYYSLLRLLQNLGTYGLRGIRQGKSLFTRSIDPAMDNLRHILQNELNLSDYPEMKTCLEKLSQTNVTENKSE